MSSLILLATLCVESLRIGEWTSVFDKLEGPAAIAQHPDGGILIADRLAGEIADIGDVRVWCVEDAINSVATGALKLASEMPDDMYTSIN